MTKTCSPRSVHSNLHVRLRLGMPSSWSVRPCNFYRNRLVTPFHARGQPLVFRIPFGSTPRSRVLIAGPATDVQGPVWVDCYSPAPGWRIPPGYSPYSPLFSNYSPTTSGWYSPSILPGASNRRRLPQRRLRRQNGAARRRRAPRTADRCKSALISSDQL